MKIKHSDQKCNICGEVFSTVTDLLQHMADKHSKKTIHFECVKAKDDIYGKGWHICKGGRKPEECQHVQMPQVQ